MTKWVVLALALSSPLFACGPSCPSADAHRADFPTDDRAGALSIHLERNVLTQSNGLPARLFFTWTTDEEAAVAEIVGASGAVVLRHALAKSAGPRVDMQLVDEQGVLLPGGAYRLVVTTSHGRVSAPFEMRHCLVYY